MFSMPVIRSEARSGPVHQKHGRKSFTTPNIGETSLVFASLADSVFHNHTVWLGASILVLAIACMIHHIWPMRLTRVLVTVMKETEKVFYDAVEAGELPRDAGTEEELLGLQKKVSEIREDSLRNSLSTWTALGDFFKGRSITLLQCRDDIQRFNTHLEILKETQMRTHLNSTNPGTAALAMSLKRRHNR
ncbi:hypothetical protein C8J57DRAFT_1722740 [Mycena rebaudengoi]|nr:hypothetical protein C8J57DRAFT_1722740 [Mycena rebaudengoi]